MELKEAINKREKLSDYLPVPLSSFRSEVSNQSLVPLNASPDIVKVFFELTGVMSVGRTARLLGCDRINVWRWRTKTNRPSQKYIFRMLALVNIKQKDEIDFHRIERIDWDFDLIYLYTDQEYSRYKALLEKTGWKPVP